MATSPLSVQTGAALDGLAADSRSLDKLRSVANQDPAKAVKQVATQFEALFMQMVLKSMREATPKSGMLDSNEQQTYTSMLDGQLAQKIAAGGTGLADVIARQLSRNLPAPATSPGAAAANPASATAAGAVTAGTAVAPGLSASRPSPGGGATGLAAPGNVLNNLRDAAAVRGKR